LLVKIVLGLAKDLCWSSSFLDVSPMANLILHSVKDQNILMKFRYEKIFEGKKLRKLYQSTPAIHMV
jgi:hypothetical protein